jgi:hypothetical protein
MALSGLIKARSQLPSSCLRYMPQALYSSSEFHACTQALSSMLVLKLFEVPGLSAFIVANLLFAFRSYLVHAFMLKLSISSQFVYI